MDDAYEKIGSIVEQWCKKNMYTTMLVTISIGYEWETPHEETHLLEWDCENHCLVWEIDWWEGQQHVELVGFAPLHEIKLHGVCADVAPIVRCKDCRHRDPEDKKCDSGQMERQGCPFPVHDDYFCAYGAKTDKEEQT